MNKITYIISHKSSTYDRDVNLLTILDWLKYVNDIEKVIIVEQDIESRFGNKVSKDKYNYKLEYHFIKNVNGTFNKSWAYNYGSKLTETEWIAFGDNDVMMDIDDINEEISNNLGKYDSFSPYKYVIDLNQIQTNAFLENKDFYDINKSRLSKLKNKRLEHKKKLRMFAPYGGGIFFIKTKSLFEIGAWDENFINWGGEDDDISKRISENLNYFISEKDSYHLYHKRRLESTSNNKHYLNNVSILTKNKSNDLKHYLSKFDVNKIGLKDKYCK